MNAAPTKPAVDAGPQTLEEFMAQALAMENEAVERYTELADAMAEHNNHEVATLFRTMAGHEAKHGRRIMAEMGWRDAPPATVRTPAWPDSVGPETLPFEGAHYLMQPWHALQMALAAERQAEAFFATLAKLALSEPVRAAALEMRAEEAHHVSLIQSWLEKVPKPDPDWANDPDPPRYTD